MVMTQQEGLRSLGLDNGATATEIALAYRSRSLPLKTQILSAPRAMLKERYRDDLRDLVTARQAALGRKLAEGWTGPAIGINAERLGDALSAIPADGLNAEKARAFLGLPKRATKAQVLAAYSIRARALIRRFAAASDDYELATVRRARLKLRTVRNFALPQ